MDNFTSKIKQHRVLGINLLRFFSIVLTLFCIAGAGTRTDTVYVSGGLKATRLTVDSATIPIFKGNETHRGVVTFNDSGYFAGGLRGLRLYFPQADIDSLVGDVKAGAGIGAYYGSSYIKFGYAQGDLPGSPSSYLPVIKSNFERMYFTTYNATRQYYAGFIGYQSGGTNFALRDSSGASPAAILLSTNGASYVSGSFKAAACTVTDFRATTKIYTPVLDADSVVGPTTHSGLFKIVNTTNSHLRLKRDNDSTMINIGGTGTSGYAFNIINTDDIQFTTNGTERLRILKNGGITIAGGSTLDAYITGSFPCTLKTSDVTVQQIGTAYYTKIGNVVTISFPYLYGTSNSTTLLLYCVIPYYPKQTLGSDNVSYETGSVLDNSFSTSAMFKVNDATPTYVEMVKHGGGAYTSSGNKGVMGGSIRYITEN